MFNLAVNLTCSCIQREFEFSRLLFSRHWCFQTSVAAENLLNVINTVNLRRKSLSEFVNARIFMLSLERDLVCKRVRTLELFGH